MGLEDDVFGFALHVFGQGFVKDLFLETGEITFTSYEGSALVARTYLDARTLQQWVCRLLPDVFVDIHPFVWVWEPEEAL